MKKVLASLFLLLGASSAFAQTSNTVRWQSFAGVITAQNVDNPVSANIHIGTFAWTVRGGRTDGRYAHLVGLFDIPR